MRIAVSRTNPFGQATALGGGGLHGGAGWPGGTLHASSSYASHESGEVRPGWIDQIATSFCGGSDTSYGVGHGVASVAHDSSEQPRGTIAHVFFDFSTTMMVVVSVAPGGHAISRGAGGLQATSGGQSIRTSARHVAPALRTDQLGPPSECGLGSLPPHPAITIRGAANTVRRRNAAMSRG
jgi:hypothetical protein